MRIKILNKNNNQWYEVDEGPVRTEVKNETLDSGVIVISNQTSVIDVEPFDIVQVQYHDYSPYYMCVDTYIETLTSINPKVYKYEIHLFSETKQLENIILPNLKITKMPGITRSIYYYINQYLNEFAPDIKIGSESFYTYNKKFIWIWSGTLSHPNLETKFADECPEMQWNTPTLREVLNDLMMVKDCIPIIKNGRIDYIDLTEVSNKNWENDEHINYVTRSKSSEDYVSEIQMRMINVTNKLNERVTKKEYIPFNISNDEATMTDKNILLRTQYPIYSIKSLKLIVSTFATADSPSVITKWDKVDLMDLYYRNEHINLVYEYSEWITKKIGYMDDFPALTDYPEYQNWTLYYTRGNNEIRGFTASQKYSWLSRAYLREYLCYFAGLLNQPSEVQGYQVTSNLDIKYYTMMFEIEYETLEGCVFKASKSNKPENERVIIDNQTNSYVDSYKQGFLEYQKANRLGNEQLHINARFSPDDRIMQIGDMYDDTIIYQVQCQYFKDHIEINALATKNYILQEYFTGVKSKIRSWKIADGSEALTRCQYFKYYCEFSYEPHIEKYDSLPSLSIYEISKYMLTPFTSYTPAPLTCAFIRTKDSNNNYHPNPFSIVSQYYPVVKSYYYLDLINHIVGNSLVFTFAFQDNYWAGQSIHTGNDFDSFTEGIYPSRPSEDVYVKESDIAYDSGTTLIYIKNDALKNGGVPTIQHSYTDDNGEFISGEIVLADNMKVIPTFVTGTSEEYYEEVGQGTDWRDNELNLTEQSKKFLYYSYQRPRVYESNFRYISDFDDEHSYDYGKVAIDFNLKKDSQEIINLSTQFEFLTDTNDICFSKNWLNKQKAISTSGSLGIYIIRLYNKTNYNFRKPDNLPSGDYEQYFITHITITKNDNSNLSSRIVFEFYDGQTYSNNAAAKEAAENYVKTYCICILEYLDASHQTLLISLNNIPKDNCIGVNNHPAYVLNMNVLKTRNKNVYDADNHYLIVDNI